MKLKSGVLCCCCAWLSLPLQPDEEDEKSEFHLMIAGGKN